MAIFGSSGAGKSTLARRLSERIGAPVVELDALNWGPNWFNRSLYDPLEFHRRVSAAAAGESWIADGNYSRMQPIVLARATRMIWLDYSRLTIMTRVIRRSVIRAVVRDELWAGTGNREAFRKWLDKDHPIRWAWDTMPGMRRRYAALFEGDDWPDVTRTRLRSPREAEAFLSAAPFHSDHVRDTGI